MLDLHFIRGNPDLVRKAMQDKNETADLDKLLKLDIDRRKAVQQADLLKAERNRASEEIGKAKKAGKNADKAIQAMKKVSDEIKGLDDKIKNIESDILYIQSRIPNIPHPSDCSLLNI